MTPDRGHLWDYITDRTSRNAIGRREYGAGGGDCAPYLNEARKEGASGVTLPTGWIPVRSSVTLENFELAGEHGNAGALYPYATKGAVIEVRDAAVKPFLLGENWGLERLGFYYPLQMPKAGTPDVYEPLLQPIASDTNVSGGHMDRCSVINAYSLAKLGGNATYEKSGQNAFTNSRICALKDYFTLNHMPDWLNLAGSQFGWDLFGDPMMGYAGAPFDAGWRDWVTANSVAFRIKGDGSHSVDGPVISPAVFYGLKQIFLVEAGAKLTNLTALGVMADACQQLIRCEPGGAVVATTITLGGGCYQHRKAYESAACEPFVDIDNPSDCTGLDIKGRVQELKGSGVRVRGPNVDNYDIQLSATAVARTTTSGTYYAADVDCPNARMQRLDITAGADAPVSGGVTRHGVIVRSGVMSDVTVQLNGFQNPVEIAATAGQHTVRATISNTGGAKSLIVADPSKVTWSGKMDKPPQSYSSASLVATISGIASDTAVTVVSLALEAGEWEISGVVQFQGVSSTYMGYGICSLSSSAGALSSQIDRQHLEIFSTTGWLGVYPVRVDRARFALASAATIYVVAQAGFSGGALNIVGGKITATRVQA